MVSYAYIHCKPDGTPFYVGKGAMRRAKSFVGRNDYHQKTVKKYGVENLSYGVLECSTTDIAYQLERGLIKCFRRMGTPLCNLTDGGEGGANPSPETRKKISQAAKLRGVSDACQRAKRTAKRGKPLSAAQKAKQSAAMLGRVFTAAHRANISASAKLRGMPEYIRKKGQQANRGRKQSLEEKQRRAAQIQATLERTNKTTPVLIDGVRYASLTKAAKAIGVTPSGLLYGLRRSGVIQGRKVERVI